MNILRKGLSTLTVAGVPIDSDWRSLDPRVIRAVQTADLVIAEENKNAMRLLTACDCKDKPLLLLNEHSSDADRAAAVDKICSVAKSIFVSDAGTPCVADPDYRVVDACIRKGVEIRSVPGPSSIITALSVSGFPTGRFVFMGFPPRDKAKRRHFFNELASTKHTAVFLERPYALKQTLADMASMKQPVCLCIALGSDHEKNIRGTVKEITAKTEGIKDAFAVVVSPVTT